MSHFTKCDLKLNSLEAVKKALDDLGWAYTEAEAEVGATVRGWRGQTLEAAMSINMGKYDVGVVKNEDGSYHLTADWWGVETTKGLSEEEFKNKLNHRYSYHRVVQACEDKGYSFEEEVNEEDGSIKLVARKWVT